MSCQWLHLPKHIKWYHSTSKYSQPCSRLWIHKQLDQSNNSCRHPTFPHPSSLTEAFTVNTCLRAGVRLYFLSGLSTTSSLSDCQTQKLIVHLLTKDKIIPITCSYHPAGLGTKLSGTWQSQAVIQVSDRHNHPSLFAETVSGARADLDVPT